MRESERDMRTARADPGCSSEKELITARKTESRQWSKRK
jgi:hypothetical protein